MFATFCHFDPRPLEISAANVELMEAIARMIPGIARSVGLEELVRR